MPPSQTDCIRNSHRNRPQSRFNWTWRLSAGLAVIAAACPMPAAAGELEDKLAAICRDHDVPGIIAASVGPDGVIESASAGVRRRGSAEAVSTDDQFAIGSNSKSFTATLAAVLVDDGLIDWSTTIGEVWPDEPIHDGFKQVTLEQLLAHTSGLQPNLDGPQWASFFAERNQPEQERARMCSLVLTKAPEGTLGQYEYSNLGYVVAAAMIEKRGKRPFERLMQDRVFKPLEMTSTEFYSAAKLKRTSTPLLWGHRQDDGEPIKPGASGAENPTVYAGCGTIRTTIADWAKYIAWHMQESAAPVLKSDDTLRQLHKGIADAGAPGQTYGFGWLNFQSGYGRTLQHSGNNTNQFSLVWVMPEAQRATLVITNTGQDHSFPACDAATVVLMQSPAFQ